MTVGIIMPVWITTPELLDLTARTVKSLRSHEELILYVKRNRYTLGSDDQLKEQIEGWLPSGIKGFIFDPNRERCVAATWNNGLRVLKVGVPDLEFTLIINNDAIHEPTTIDTLVSYGRKRSDAVVLWSAKNTRDEPDIADHITDGPDFSCFMVSPSFSETMGMGFDENFTPAYFEDNDCYARIVLQQKRAVKVHAARYYHPGSMTIKSDTSAAGRNTQTFGQNQTYFAQKWGVPAPLNYPREIIQNYHLRPFGDMTKDVNWWPSPPREAYW